MHNFVPPLKGARLSLIEVGKRLRGSKRTFFVNNNIKLRRLFIDYNRLAFSGALHLLTQAVKDSPSDTKTVREEKQVWRENANALYGSNRAFVNKHWEDITKKNGGKKLKCPICGIRYCSEMDHYVPRALFPEYSSHLNNLIPLCHECNNGKGNQYLSKKGGKRVFFNAYYDDLKGESPIECAIGVSSIDGLPEVHVSFNSSLNVGIMPGSIVKSTFDQLTDLIPLYQVKASDYLRQEVIRLSNASIGARGEIMNSYPLLSQTGSIDFLQAEVFKAITISKDMAIWVKSLP
mgnify:CR=1 FL=1